MAILMESVMGNVLAISFAMVVSVIVYCRFAFQYWKRIGVVTQPPQLIFGNAKDLVLQKVGLGEFFSKIYFELKQQGVKYYAGCYMFTRPVFLVFDPDLIKQVLVKDFDHFTDHGTYYDEEVDPLSVHIFSLNGEKWKNLRVKLTPTFTSAKMKLMFQTLVDCTEDLTAILQKISKDQEPLDVKDVMGRFTTDIIGSCAFGIDCNTLKNPNSEFRIYGKKVFERTIIDSAKGLLSMVFPGLLKLFKIPFTNAEVTHFFTNLVKETVRYREENNIFRNDFMHLLIQLKNNVTLSEDGSDGNNQLINKNGGQNLTINEVAAQAFLFFLAGFETSSTTTTFLMYELAVNQHIQDKLREEIKRVLEKYDGKLSYEALTEMNYMDKCINEALRKYPPFVFLPRICTKDYKIPHSNVVIKKGVTVNIPLYGIQNDPEYYPNPEIFDPERFTDENKSKRHPFTWLPFGEGPRACIGLRFGLMQVKVGMVAMLKNYKFTVNSKTKVPLKFDAKTFFLTVEGAMWLNSEIIDG